MSLWRTSHNDFARVVKLFFKIMIVSKNIIIFIIVLAIRTQVLIRFTVSVVYISVVV